MDALERAEDTLHPDRKVRRMLGEHVPEDVEDARETLALLDQARQEQREVEWLEQDERRDVRTGEARARKHRHRALELGTVRARLKQSAEGHERKAADLVDGREAERLPDADYAAFRKAVDRAAEERKLDARLRAVQRRHERVAEKIRVVNEPAPYGPQSENSWFVDLAVSRGSETAALAGLDGFGDLNPAAAEERLRKHALDIRRAYAKGGRQYRQIGRLLQERSRHEDPDIHRRKVQEARALFTAGGAIASVSGGGAAAFVAPAFILDEWAPFRGINRTFADQCHSVPLPDFGMQLYVPYFSAGTSVSQQVEGSGVSDSTPTAALQSGAIGTVTGEVGLSQQLHDRGFTGGGSFDKALAGQLGQQLNEKINLYVLTQVIANGQAVSGASSWAPTTQGIAPLYTDIAKGREVLTDTAGTRLRPTHFFSTSDFYSYVTRQVDASTFRPWVVPTFAPGFPLAAGADAGLQGDQARAKWSRFTGTVLPGGVLWFEDDTIPATGSNNQLIVSAPDPAVVLAEGAPMFSFYPETFAANLAGVATLRAYVGVVLRHTAGSAILSGNAYPTSLV